MGEPKNNHQADSSKTCIPNTKDQQRHDEQLGHPGTLAQAHKSRNKVAITAEIAAYFQQGIRQFYDRSADTPLKESYLLILQQYFQVSHEIDDGIWVPLLPPSGKLPSFRQFLHWYKEYILSRQRHLLPEPPSYPPSYSSARGESSTGSIFGPGSLYHIFAIPGDVSLVSLLDTRRPIGHPTTYLALDSFSQAIVGVHVSLSPPDWEGVFQCLQNAAKDKVQFCRAHGLEVTEAQWPTQRLPEALLIEDLSELAGDSADILDYLVKVLSVRILNFCSADGVQKALQFKSRHYATQLISTLHQHLQQGSGASQLGIGLTLKQYWMLILLLTLRHNHAERMHWYPLDDDMTSAHVAPYPIPLWRWGIQYRTGQLRRVD